MLMNKPCWLLLQLVSNINFLSPLSLAHSQWALLGPLYFTLQDPVGLSPRARTPGITAIFTGHDCAWRYSENQIQAFRGMWGNALSPIICHIWSRGHRKDLLIYISRDPRWKEMDLQSSARGPGSIKGSYGRVWTGITLTFLSFLYQRPMSFCLSSVR